MVGKRVWITGAHGFLGRKLSKACADRGYSVLGLGHGEWSAEEARTYGIERWERCDLTLVELNRISKTTLPPETIFHCAGGASVPFSIRSPEDDFERTVSTTEDLLEFARIHASGTSIVYPSSGAVYGQTAGGPIMESASANPVSPYGRHKRVAEERIISASEQFGVRSSIVRFFSIYGTGLRKQLFWDASLKWFQRKSEDDVLVFSGTGEEVRDWLHVGDAASLLLEAAENASPACPIVNGGSGTGTRVRDALELLLSTLDGRHIAPVFSGAAREGDPTRFVADIRRAHEWGWEPRVSLSDGVKEYANWVRSEMQ